jgi:hypothetical protein
MEPIGDMVVANVFEQHPSADFRLSVNELDRAVSRRAIER